MKKYTIKDLSSIAGINSQTLRRYESLGIVHPERSKGNEYRMYEWRDFVQLLRIRSLRNYGFGLHEICDVYESGADDADEIFDRHISETTEELQRLEKQLRLAQDQSVRLKQWKELKETGFRIMERPQCVVFPYRNQKTEDMLCSGAGDSLKLLLEHMPPLRSCSLVYSDPQTHANVSYGGLYAYTHELQLPDIPPEEFIFLPPCRCLVTAVEGHQTMNYRSFMAPESPSPEWNIESMKRVLEPMGFTVCGEVITDILHMQKLEADKSVSYMRNFRSFMTSWIPIEPINC